MLTVTEASQWVVLVMLASVGALTIVWLARDLFRGD